MHRKLQALVLGFFLIILSATSEDSISLESSLVGNGDVSNGDFEDQSLETSKSPLLGATEASSSANADAASETTTSDDFEQPAERSEQSTSLNLDGLEELKESSLLDSKEDSTHFSGAQDASQSPLFANIDASSSEDSSSMLVDKSVEKSGFEGSADFEQRERSEYSPKNQEESLLLLEDPNYTVDDALLLLKKQRKIQENARGRSKQAAEPDMHGSEYNQYTTEYPVDSEYYVPSFQDKTADLTASSAQEQLSEEEESPLQAKELSPPKESEDSPVSLPLSLNSEESRKDHVSEHSQSNSDVSVEDPELISSYTEKSKSEGNDEISVSNPFDTPFSERSKSNQFGLNIERESSKTLEKENGDLEQLDLGNSLETPENEASVSRSNDDVSNEEDKVLSEPQIVSAPSSVSSPDESEEEKSTESSVNNETSKSEKTETPDVDSESEPEGENKSVGENEALVDSYSNVQDIELIPEQDSDENSLNRSLLEARDQSAESGELSQGQIMDKSQSIPQFEASPLLFSETLRNEESADRLRGILLPLVDMFQVSIGCAAPCPYQRYFIQTDRVLKRISKMEAKTIELLNIMKKAREITIKEVSDIFKFHQTAAKRRALLYVQKHLKAAKLLHFKIEAAKKTVLFALKIRIILQLLPSKYSREYTVEELDRFGIQVDLALKEYNGIRSSLGSKTLKYGIVRHLSLGDYDQKIHSFKSILDNDLAVFVSKMPTFQKFVSKHRKLSFTLYDMMDKAGYPIKKKYFMVDRKGLTKEQLRLYKKKVNEDDKQAKNRLGKKEYAQFKNSREGKWKQFSNKVYSS
ncbi:hypothetical protein OJ253_2734 [Cryptosporidium canis]|uniref:Uncharacterized protein n=1 Tax=Cryptosporidium canis TaxID=195482 RepID=A0A9D5HXX4_9CRYT|nr:hypothetical protein OJ253_2734 [Cryptosporidium canis]